MKTSNKNFAFLLAPAILLVACSPKYYSPNTQNVPLLKEKGDVRVTAAGNGSRLELQGAYAHTANQGIMFNAAIFPRKSSESQSGGSGSMIEAGYGFFKPLENNWHFETFGIVGLGSMENHFLNTVTNNPGTDGKINANLFRYGIQPALGYSTDKVDLILASRITNLNYSKIGGSLIYNNENQQNFLTQRKSNTYLEPSVTLRVGAKNAKFQLQYLHSYNMTRGDLNQDKNVVTFGMHFAF